MSAETWIAGDAGSLPVERTTESLVAGDGSSAEMSMNAMTVAAAQAAQARAQAMFHRVLSGWASDVLRLERERRCGRHWPGARSHDSRAAA